MQLGYCPRIHVRFTSEREKGQIYIPNINWLLLLVVIILVLGFKSSSNLASAYGIAVTSTMVITTLLFAVVAWRRWHWKPWVLGVVTAFFLVVDCAFLGANLVKIPDGGWFPLLIGGAIFLLMMTWKQGRGLLNDSLRQDALDLHSFLEAVFVSPPARVDGTAVFLTAEPGTVPNALLHNLKHNNCLLYTSPSPRDRTRSRMPSSA